MANDKLTDMKLRSLTRADVAKPQTFADGGGLSVRVTPSQKSTVNSGKRPPNNLLWLFRYRNLHKSPNPLTLVLGRYPDLSLSAARAQRDKCKSWLADNLDPKDQYKITSTETLAPVTVKQALQYWVDNYAKEDKKRKNWGRHQAQLDKHIFPYIGDMPLSLCETKHWLECFDRTKKNAPVAAGYIFQMCKQALKYCRVRRYAYSNALDDLAIPDVGKKQAKRDRVHTETELADICNAITSGTYFLPYYNALLQILLVFGARTHEVRLSEPKEWDVKSWVWTVPKEHSKGSEKIARPIPEAVRPFILSLIEQNKDTGLLLGELKNAEAVSQWGRGICKRLGHSEPWTLHDLRRTFSTTLNDLGIAPHIVEGLLGHTLGGVMAIYNRSQYLPEKLSALNVWMDKLAGLQKITNEFRDR
ncbi:TPA: tyrosine-type recombinase/integrase [Klebsiella michiganensis]